MNMSRCKTQSTVHRVNLAMRQICESVHESSLLSQLRCSDIKIESSGTFLQLHDSPLTALSTPSTLRLPTGVFFFTVPRTRMWKAEFIWYSTPGHLTCSRHGIVGTLRDNERSIPICKSCWKGSQKWILATSSALDVLRPNDQSIMANCRISLWDTLCSAWDNICCSRTMHSPVLGEAFIGTCLLLRFTSEIAKPGDLE